MNINIIAVGKVKEKYFIDAIKDYEKMLNSYSNLIIFEIPDEPCPENLSEKDMTRVKEIEGKKILSKIKGDSYTIALDLNGKDINSVELANKMKDIMLNGFSTINFIIGGSLGLSDEVLSHADFRLSFSKMTFPHKLMRLILIEQIYRTFRIINNHPYHK